MKNKELFERTVNVLVNAYQKETLQHQVCQACAVGNIIADFNPEVNRKEYPHLPCFDYVWFDVVTKFRNVENYANSTEYNRGLKHIQKTGYSIKNISDIEHAFERSSKDGDWMFNGLMSVVDCLMIIHEANETEVIEAKSLFIKETA